MKVRRQGRPEPLDVIQLRDESAGRKSRVDKASITSSKESFKANRHFVRPVENEVPHDFGAYGLDFLAEPNTSIAVVDDHFDLQRRKGTLNKRLTFRVPDEQEQRRRFSIKEARPSANEVILSYGRNTSFKRKRGEILQAYRQKSKEERVEFMK